MSKRKGGRFTTFLIGGVMGAIGGILLAPKSGKKTREDLMKKADEMLEQSKDAYSTQMDKVEGALGSGRDMATERVEDIRARIEETKKKLQSQVEEASKKAEKATDSVKKKISKK